MSTPTSNVLTLLELLQSRPQSSGEELARRLGVSARQLRRYVTALQDMGIPVETGRGRYGGYRLGPGYRLPPLMLNNDEAVALALGLLAVQRLNLTGTTPAVGGTLAKVRRVLPAAVKERVVALEESLVLYFDQVSQAVDSAFVMTLSTAVGAQRRVWLSYRSWQGGASEREVDPYGLVYYNEAWYVAGYCHLREAIRTFRLDRIAELSLQETSFIRPPTFDTLAHVEMAIASTPGDYAVEVVLETSLKEAREKIPAWLATLEETPAGVLMRAQAREPLGLPWLAHFLTGLGWPLVVKEPSELREEIRRLAHHAAQIAMT